MFAHMSSGQDKWRDDDDEARPSEIQTQRTVERKKAKHSKGKGKGKVPPKAFSATTRASPFHSSPSSSSFLVGNHGRMLDTYRRNSNQEANTRQPSRFRGWSSSQRVNHPTTFRGGNVSGRGHTSGAIGESSQLLRANQQGRERPLWKEIFRPSGHSVNIWMQSWTKRWLTLAVLPVLLVS